MKQAALLRSRTILLFLLTAAICIPLFSGCSSKSSIELNHSNKSNKDHGNKIKIVAVENFYGEVAEAVGGDLVEVISLLDRPEADPHDYEPTPEASKDVHHAKIVIYNGAGYDEWMTKLINASGDAGNKTVIAVAPDIAGIAEGANEHVWYNPETMPKLAVYLADKLAQIDPEHRDIFKKQADEYIASLGSLSALVADLKQTSPLPIAASEPIFNYMAQALNLQLTNSRFALAAEEGIDPAPKDMAHLQNEIKGKVIKMFINNIQSSSITVDNMVSLCKENGIPVIEVTEMLPAGQTYLQWMVDILKQIKAGL